MSQDNSARNRDTSKYIARVVIGAYYDYQEQRKSFMNRIRDLVRKKKEGIPFDEPEEEKEDKEQDEYDKWTDDEVMDELKEMLENDEFNDEEMEYVEKMLDLLQDTQEMEDKYKWFMQRYEQEPIYREFLDHVRGIGTIHTANLIYRIGYCEDYKHVSNLWSHFGLDPDSPKKRQAGEEFNYNPELRTLAYKISDNLVRANGIYKQQFYNPYKERQLEKMELAEEGKMDEFDGSAPENKQHAHIRAKRYMVKKFLKHYWVLAREIKGEETTEPWITQHGGHDNREESYEDAHYMQKQLQSKQ